MGRQVKRAREKGGGQVKIAQYEVDGQKVSLCDSCEALQYWARTPKHSILLGKVVCDACGGMKGEKDGDKN